MLSPWGSTETAQSIISFWQFASPLAVLFFYFIAQTLRSVWAAKRFSEPVNPSSQQLGPGGKPLPKKRKPRNGGYDPALDFSAPRKLLFGWLSVILALTFFANGTNVVVHAIVDRDKGWWCGEAATVYIVGGFFVFIMLTLSLVDTKPSPTTAHLATWIFILLIEVILLGASLAVYTRVHVVPTLLPVATILVRRGMSAWESVEILIDCVRIVTVTALSAFYLIFAVERNRFIKATRRPEEADETTPLLRGTHDGCEENGHTPEGQSNVTARGNKQTQTSEDAPAGWEKPKDLPQRSWWEYVRGYSVFFPYLWPAKDRRLQVHVVICLLLVVFGRVANVLVPIEVGVIIDSLSKGEQLGNGLDYVIVLYVVLRMVSGNMGGLIVSIRSWLWIPVAQYSYRELSAAAFEHVHGLSLDFHLGKRTGEVLSALGKGNSINSFLEQVTFSVLPMLVDVVLAIVAFCFYFDAYYALTIAIVVQLYVYITIRMAAWRADLRRKMTDASREEDAVKNDSMVAYETVKYFNAESYEFHRYRNAINTFQNHEYAVIWSLQLLNFVQTMIFMLGLLITCFICAHQIASGKLDVGKFATLITYMAQLQAPLNFFGTFYRTVQSNMINAERMLELFKEQPTVVDKPGTLDMHACNGQIVFNDVHFAYDKRKPALKGLSFTCQPGTTTALVGESGGGKSTVFRLLFRYYNVTAGNIYVDNHDVSDISIESLRLRIGVVPQDTVLFNDTLMYNLKYANQDATDEYIHDACRAASIHEKILTFPDGYNTRVGERGLRLSGGEKQRVAIARTIIKNPRIILLDEATAALDTQTEGDIQEALATVGEGRTMLVIAHRLSTITKADQIIVLNDGRVDEVGTHEELLALNGRYANMWANQVEARAAREQAKKMNAKADRLIGDGGEEGESTPNLSDEEPDDARKRGGLAPKPAMHSRAPSGIGEFGHGMLGMPPGHA